MKKICQNCKWFEKTDTVIATPEGWCFRMPHTEPKSGISRCGEFEEGTDWWKAGAKK